MTVQEAIEIITNAVRHDEMTAEQYEALAIVQKAAEKQMPKLAVFEADGYDDEGKFIYDIAYCPNCNSRFDLGYDEETNCCPNCGQALDWGVKMSKISEKELKTLELQVEIVKHLLKYRYTWEEISEAVGFSEEWLISSEKLIGEHEMKSLP